MNKCVTWPLCWRAETGEVWKCSGWYLSASHYSMWKVQISSRGVINLLFHPLFGTLSLFLPSLLCVRRMMGGGKKGSYALCFIGFQPSLFWVARPEICLHSSGPCYKNQMSLRNNPIQRPCCSHSSVLRQKQTQYRWWESANAAGKVRLKKKKDLERKKPKNCQSTTIEFWVHTEGYLIQTADMDVTA